MRGLCNPLFQNSKTLEVVFCPLDLFLNDVCECTDVKRLIHVVKSPYAKRDICFCDSASSERVTTKLVILVETGIQISALPDLDPCVRRDDSRSVFSNCAQGEL